MFLQNIYILYFSLSYKFLNEGPCILKQLKCAAQRLIVTARLTGANNSHTFGLLEKNCSQEVDILEGCPMSMQYQKDNKSQYATTMV